MFGLLVLRSAETPFLTLWEADLGSEVRSYGSATICPEDNENSENLINIQLKKYTFFYLLFLPKVF